MTKKKKKGKPYKIPTETNNFLGEYIESLQAEGKSKNTLRAYLTAAEQYLIYHKTNIKSISQQSTNKFFNKFDSRTQTQSLKKNAVISFINFLNNIKKFNKNISIKIKNVPRVEPEYLTYEEQKKLLDLLKYDKRLWNDYFMFALMLYEGLRLNEVLNLRLGDINGQYIFLRESKSGVRRLYLKKSLQTVLKNDFMPRRKNTLPAGKEDFLFLSNRKRRFDSTSILKKLNKHLEAAGIKKKLSPHGLRHTFAARLRENGVPIEVIARQLGHKNIQTTLIYTHITKEQEIEAIESL